MAVIVSSKLIRAVFSMDIRERPPKNRTGRAKVTWIMTAEDPVDLGVIVQAEWDKEAAGAGTPAKDGTGLEAKSQDTEDAGREAGGAVFVPLWKAGPPCSTWANRHVDRLLSGLYESGTASAWGVRILVPTIKGGEDDKDAG